MSRTLIHIEGVTKRFGELAAVKDVSLEIVEGEFFALLGPSGCGKTTLLRMLAGLEVADQGRILIDGQDMTGVPPNRRPVNMVFQSYAVFPHMNVADNVAYGLRMDGVARAERDARVAEALGLVKLGGMEGRRPDQLSGGQRQRVALARALVKRPRVLLLDEPLSALDAKLREAMRSELAQIQDRVGVTFVMVTHDQEEALAMASRCAVMNNGLIEQIASPSDLYEYPVNRFVADFIGSVNLFEGKLTSREGANAAVGCPELAGAVQTNHAVSGAVGDAVWVAIRPEKIAMAAGETGAASANTAAGRIKQMSYLGSETLYEVELANGRRVKVLRPNFARAGTKEFEGDQPVSLSWTAESVALLTS